MSYDSRPDTWEHINKVQTYIGRAVYNLIIRGLNHDQSKLHPPEVEKFDEMTPILSTLTYGTPEYKESTAKLGVALQHHYAENPHHPEHYSNGVDGMSLLDLIEMLCDWKAASERIKPKVEAVPGERAGETANLIDSLEYNATRHNIDPQLKSILANTIHEMGFA